MQIDQQSISVGVPVLNQDWKKPGKKQGEVLTRIRKNGIAPHTPQGKMEKKRKKLRRSNVTGSSHDGCNGGAVKLTASIEDPVVIRRILDHLEQRANSNLPHPARTATNAYVKRSQSRKMPVTPVNVYVI